MVLAPKADPELVADAERMRLLLASPEWDVLAKYLGRLRDEALRHLTDPHQEDQTTHHWRGVYIAHCRALGTPQEIIGYATAQRAA